jgi:chromosome segregation ATPase
MNILEKLFLWLFPKYKQVYIELFKLNNSHTGLQEEIEANKSYIEKCEEKITELKQKNKWIEGHLKNLGKQLIDNGIIPHSDLR